MAKKVTPPVDDMKVASLDAIDLVRARCGIRDPKFAQFELLKRLRDGSLHAEDWCFDPITGEEIRACPLQPFWRRYVAALIYWDSPPEPPSVPEVLQSTCGFYFYAHELDREFPAPGAAGQDDVSAAIRRRRRSEKDWRTHVADKIYRDLRAGKPVPTLTSLAQFCGDTIDYEPDRSDMNTWINTLLERLLA